MTASTAGCAAIVTGGSRGLGLAIARELGRRGARLVICARDAAQLERAADMLRADGIQVAAVPCDITSPGAPAALIDAAMSRYGRLDILVNNAGIIQVGPLASVDFGDIETAVATMALAPARLALAVVPVLRAGGGGRIVNVTSVGGKISVPHLLPYCMAKFAAVAFSEGLRAELGAGPVTVTTAVPGLMRTGSHVAALFRGQQDKEFTWFGLSASLPLLSMDAERAARRIVAAALAGKPEVTLTPAAQIGARAAAVFPGLTARLLHLAAMALPGDGPVAGTGEERSPLAAGRDLRPAVPGSLFDRLTALGRSAARRLNQRSASGTTADQPAAPERGDPG
ncbi:MAG TPA: SDR family oxidoreductase [Trebonia sp.]|nr:SDR family oxidoreductase [Trebonia sp.]